MSLASQTARRGAIAALGQMVELTYADEVMADAPLAYWPLGSGGTSEVDASGNGRTATWSSAPTATQLLSGTSGGVTLGGTLQCNVGYGSWRQSTRSIEAWLKFTGSSGLAIMSDRISVERWGLYHGVNGNYLQFNAAKNGGALTDFVAGPTLNDGNLHHVVAVITGTHIRLYVDGTLYSSTTNVYDPATASESLGLASEGASRYFNGQAAHFALYPTALTADRILAHYQRGLF